MPSRLIIADSHESVRRGMRQLLEASDIQVVADASSGQEAIDQTFRYMPDILVTELHFHDVGGIEVVGTIREKLPALPIMVLSDQDLPTFIARATLQGVSEYVLKSESCDAILDAVHRVLVRATPPDDSLIMRIRELMARRRPEFIEQFPLTQREFQVLRHLALGLSNREIGRSLTISIETVKEHVQNILRKIQASDRTQAAVWAVKQGMAKF